MRMAAGLKTELVAAVHNGVAAHPDDDVQARPCGSDRSGCCRGASPMNMGTAGPGWGPGTTLSVGTQSAGRPKIKGAAPGGDLAARGGAAATRCGAAIRRMGADATWGQSALRVGRNQKLASAAAPPSGGPMGKAKRQQAFLRQPDDGSGLDGGLRKTNHPQGGIAAPQPRRGRRHPPSRIEGTTSTYQPPRLPTPPLRLRCHTLSLSPRCAVMLSPRRAVMLYAFA